MNQGIARALVWLGVLLALGMSAGAFILGMQARHIGAGKSSVTVKGLAEKPVKADLAEWHVAVKVHGEDIAATLRNLRAERPLLDAYLAKQGFPATAIQAMPESVVPHMVQESTDSGQTRQVQRGFVGSQELVVTSKDLARMATAHAGMLQQQAEGRHFLADAPLYLVSNLEEVKMSLIGAATRNALQRAEEFTKIGSARVGVMRSASQGAFYILASGADSSADDYGGVYDKTTVDKTARVVVTIEYGIER